MILIVGLGNIGRKYKTTRHNAGFLLLDKIIEDYNLTFQGEKFKSELFSGEILGKKVLALKPNTFMNLSGEAVLMAAKFYKIDVKNIIVFHDDIDLEFGKIKVKTGGGNAGHNGLKSIDGIIGKNYKRLRFGVGRPENKDFEVSDYVLSKFSKGELDEVERLGEVASDNIELLFEGELEKFGNCF